MWLDHQKTLRANHDRDTWQLPVISLSGEYLGNVVGQVIEPSKYMIRYFLIYNPHHERRFLLPLDSVLAIGDKVQSNLEENQILKFPHFTQEILRDDEKEIYQIISLSPYWEEDILT